MSCKTKIIDHDVALMIAIRASGGNKSIEVIDHHLESYSKNKIGFLGNHQRLEIIVKKTKECSELTKLSFFVKSLKYESEEYTSFVKNVFIQEVNFFNQIMPQLLEVTSVGNIHPWGPKCYLANDELIVLEDVRNSGYLMGETKIIMGEDLKSAIRAMARFHAASMLVEKKIGRPLNKVYPTACAEQLFNESLMTHGLHLIESLIKGVAKKNNLDSRPVLEYLKRVIKYMSQSRHGNNCVICHGDAWSNNFMLDSSEPRQCILVDYQMVRYVPRMVDVAQLLYLSTTREVRRCEERDAIETYWEELCDTLRKCNPAFERPSLETIRQEYDDDAKLVAQLTAIMYYPTIFLSKDIFTEYKHNPEVLYKKLIFRTNNDCVFEVMDKDEDYASRITEVVIEFIEDCERLKQSEK